MNNLLAEILLVVRAKLDQFDRDLASVRTRAKTAGDDSGDAVEKGMSKGFDKISDGAHKTFSAIKTAAIAAGAAIAVGVVKGVSSALSAGSDLAETISKSREIFGKNADDMERWASTAATSFGQSKQGALDAASTFGNLFSQLGIGAGTVKSMSATLVELASDFASFHNADPAEVIEAMTAAFRSEYDAVQRYVPTLNAAAVEQKALEMGLAGTTGELTDQHKALATSRLLFDGAGKALGDFDRTNKGAANRMRIWRAKFEDFKAGIGTVLMPIALKGMDVVDKFGAVVSGAFAKGRKDSNVLDHTVASIRSFIGAFRNAEDGITSSGIEGRFEAFGIAARKVWDQVRENWPKIRQTITDVVQAVVGFVRDRWPQIRDTITETLRTVVEVVKGAVTIVRTIWDNFGSHIVDVISTAWDFVMRVIENALKIIQGVVKVVTGLIKGDWSQVWDGIKQILSAAWDAMKSVVGLALDALKIALSVAWEVIKGVASGAWDGIKSVISGAWNGIVRVVRSGVANVVDTVFEMGERLIGIADWAFGWIPLLRGPIDDAKAKFREFRDSVNASIRGIDSEKSITVTVRQVSEFTGIHNPLKRGAGGPVPFAAGDVVPGSGNRDTVPAMLTPGEFVVRKSAVSAVGLDTLRRINAMSWGGLVRGGDGGSWSSEAVRLSDADRSSWGGFTVVVRPRALLGTERDVKRWIREAIDDTGRDNGSSGIF